MEIASKRADIQVPERLSHNERTTNKLIFDEIIQIKRDLDQQRYQNFEENDFKRSDIGLPSC
jgi:hypothetical protein